MAVTNFIPELWEAAVQVPFDKALVYAQPSVSNREYEGKIKQMGDTVHVTSIDSPTIKQYDKTEDIEVEDLTDQGSALVIDQGDYFAFRVNDVDAVQAAGNFRSPALTQAGIGLRDKLDQFIASLFVNNTTNAGGLGPIPANRLGEQTVVDGGTKLPGAGQILAFDVLIKLRAALDKQSVPLEGRWCAITAGFHSALLQDDRFTRVDASGDSQGLRNGIVGRAVGFDILMSNNNPAGSGGTEYINAGVPAATSVAQQILQTEALRAQNRFADIVRGLNVYGGKVFRPEGIATARVKFAAGTGTIVTVAP